MARDLGRDVLGFGLAQLGSQKNFMQENFGLIFWFPISGTMSEIRSVPPPTAGDLEMLWRPRLEL